MSTQPDPDVTPSGVVTPLRAEVPVLLAVAIGGVLGAEARYGLSRAWPHPVGAFPWSTLLINVTGSFLLGVLLVVIERRPGLPRLTRPLLGTGVLGGYTTFSTFGVDAAQSMHHGRVSVALLYVAITLVSGVLAVVSGRWVAQLGSAR